MPAQWTADIIGEMHLNGITKKQLAVSMGVTPEYLSMVLNGHRNPVGAEQKVRAAIDRIIERKANSSDAPTS